MRAIQISEVKTLKPIEIDEPSAPGPGEALVRTHRMGVCGTDISCYLGKFPFFDFPRIPGHELGVEVVAVGDGVTNVKAGDKCSIEPYMHCGECYPCRRGAINCCQESESHRGHDGRRSVRVVLGPRFEASPIGKAQLRSVGFGRDTRDWLPRK